MYKISCFADEISPRLDQQLDEMEKLNVKWMSLRSVDDVNVLQLSDARVDEIAHALKERGMGVSSIGSPIGKTQIADKSNLYIEQTRRAIEIAKRLECNRIRIFSFYMDKDEIDARRGEVIDRIKRMSELAAREGITLMHENEAGIYGESSARCRDLLESVNMPNFKAVYDPSNFVGAGEAPLDESLPNIREYVDYLHVKDSRKTDNVIVPCGEGDAQIADILPLFADGDYFLTLEPHLAIVGRERGFSGAQLFEVAHSALTGLLKNAGIQYT